MNADVKISEEQMRSVIDKIGDLSEPVGATLLIKIPAVKSIFKRSFLCIGSMSSPQKSYHLEFVCTVRIKRDNYRVYFRI